MTREFKDPIYGYVSVPESLVEEVIDTAPFQRLRHVRQLAATYLVYPGATHTRFEHSLGVYHLGKTVFESLRSEPYFTSGVDDATLDRIGRTLEAACLLHDVGHPPLSHLAEHCLDVPDLRRRLADLGLVDRFRAAGLTGRDGGSGGGDGDAEPRDGSDSSDDSDSSDGSDGSGGSDDSDDDRSVPEPIATAAPHELLGCVLILDRYGDPLRSFGVDPHEVSAYVLGCSLERQSGGAWQHGAAADLLHSPIDVDRLDYITRDDHMTGADVLQVDTERMVAAYTAHPDAGLALSEKALSAIGNYLEGRISLYVWVTQHHKSVYANVLMRRLLDELVAAGDGPVVSVEAVLAGMDDHALMERFRAAAPRGACGAGHGTAESDGTGSGGGSSPVGSGAGSRAVGVDRNAGAVSDAFADLYRRFRTRTFPESCWKHRLGYTDVVAGDPDRYTDWLLADRAALSDRLAGALDLPSHEVWIERSYVPAYEPAQLRDIPLAHNGRVQSLADHGLYGDRAFEESIPFVYVPEGYVEAAIDRLNGWYRAGRDAGVAR